MQREDFGLEYWPEGRLEQPSQLLSLKERDRRWNKIREEMKKRGLDCLVAYDGPLGNELSATCRYIANSYGIVDARVIFGLEGNPVLFTYSETQEDLAKKLVWPGVDVVVAGWGIPTWGVINKVKELGYEKGTIGIVGLSDYVWLEGWLPHTAYTLLQRFLSDAKLEDATTMMTDITAIKSEEEIKLIEKASEIGDKAVETMLMYARPGVMEQEVWARIMYTIISEGGDASLHGSWHIMTIGDWQYMAAPIVKHHMIKEGDVILTEFYPKYGNYPSHPIQPVFIGKVHEDYEKCCIVASESVKEGLAAMTPRHTWMEVGEAFAKPVREAGMWGIHVAAHGLSMSQPDPPFVPMPGCERRKVDKKYPGTLIEQVPELESLWRKKASYLNRKVQPNMVIGIEPRACIGHRGVYMGPTVVTTEGYPRILTKYGREIIRV